MVVTFTPVLFVGELRDGITLLGIFPLRKRPCFLRQAYPILAAPEPQTVHAMGFCRLRTFGNLHQVNGK